MRLSPCLPSLMTAMLCSVVLGGCASTEGRPSWNLSLAPKAGDAKSKSVAKTDESSKDAKDSKEAKKPDEKSSSPFQSTKSSTAKSESKSDAAEKSVAARDDKAAAKPEAKPAETPKTTLVAAATAAGSMSPDTLELIDRELKDATPEEREQWYARLKKVDADVVPEILRMRRLSLEVAERQRDAAEPSVTETASPGDWGHSPQPSTPRGSENVRPGLGAKSPWPGTGDSASPYAWESDVRQASVENPQQSGGVVTADHVASNVDRRAEHAVHRVDSQAPSNPVILQSFDGQESDPAGNPPNELGPTIAVPRQTVGVRDPRAASSVANPTNTGVPWPPNPQTAATKPAPSPNRNPVTAPLQYGAGLVQSVAGLVPNRGTAANPPQVTPAVQQTSNDWQAELQRLIALLESQIAGSKPGTTPESQAEYIRLQASLRMLYLMAGQQERALTAIPEIDPADQEFWQQIFWGLSNYLDDEHIPQAKDRATQTINQLNTAVRRLQERADVQIRNVAFCRQIQYFGNYDRFPRDEFRPGQEVLLYAEVDNFKSEPTADGQYRTLLRSTVEIVSPNGDVRKQIEFPATEDVCRNYRRDYFHNYQFTVPDRIPLGPHTLKLTIFDELSGKFASYSLNFVVK